jgi:hypothetical protein
MIVHKVREPFMCREGQFNEGRQDLCIGLDYHAIKSTNSFWCYLGKNTKTHYEIDCSEALKIGQHWKNKKGKLVIIVPLSIAKLVKIPENKNIKIQDKVDSYPRIYNERRLYFGICDGCGRVNYQSFKRSRIHQRLCRSCRRKEKLISEGQLSLL